MYISIDPYIIHNGKALNLCYSFNLQNSPMW